MSKLGMEDGEAIEHNWVSKAIENAQRKVEGRNFDIRKQLLEFDDVANEQRKVVYDQRNALMDSEDIRDAIDLIQGEFVQYVIDSCIPRETADELWEIDRLTREIDHAFDLRLPIAEWLDNDSNLTQDSLLMRINEAVHERYQQRIDEIGENEMKAVEKAVMLMVLDSSWKDHLANMDFLRQGIHLRGYAQKNPKQEYKREAFEMFSDMLQNVRHEVVRMLSRVRITASDTAETIGTRKAPPPQKMQYFHPQSDSYSGDGAAAALESGTAAPRKPVVKQVVREGRKVGRNEPCPCGSGKKYKVCCGKAA